jgi:CBS domain-containing protein
MSAMVRDAPMCHVDASVDHAIEALDSRPGWEQCVVVNDTGVVLGLVSRDTRGSTLKLADVMRSGPTTIRPDSALDDALEAMRKHKVTERVVTDPTGRLLGVLRSPAG